MAKYPVKAVGIPRVTPDVESLAEALLLVIESLPPDERKRLARLGAECRPEGKRGRKAAS